MATAYTSSQRDAISRSQAAIDKRNKRSQAQYRYSGKGKGTKGVGGGTYVNTSGNERHGQQFRIGPEGEHIYWNGTVIKAPQARSKGQKFSGLQKLPRPAPKSRYKSPDAPSRYGAKQSQTLSQNVAKADGPAVHSAGLTRGLKKAILEGQLNGKQQNRRRYPRRYNRPRARSYPAQRA